MKTPNPNPSERCLLPLMMLIACAILSSLPNVVRADQVEMVNGDRYNVKVVALTNDTLVVQNDVLGVLTVPRSKVANITLGASPFDNNPRTKPVAAAALPPVKAGARNNSAGDLNAAIRQLSTQTNLIEQVQNQFLTGADPAAKQKFNDLMNGMMTGKINMGDLRAEAQSAADQLKKLQKDLGGEGSDALDSYLAVLDGFLQETATSSRSSTNTSHSTPKSKPATSAEQE